MKTIDELGKGIEEVKEKVIKMTDKDLTLMELLDKWLDQLVYPGKKRRFVQELEGQSEPGEVQRRLCFYTDENEYYINAIERDGGKSYLGCYVRSRKMRAGEDWVRGNDLPDGPFNQETWNKIIYAIVNYELVKLTPYQKPDTIPEDVA